MGVAVRVAAHRGGALLWPENSVRAFRNALALGADLLELDVHLAADGGMAVVHDPTVDRTTDGAGAVAALSTAELRRLRLRGPDGVVTEERLPMLEEVLPVLAGSRAGLLLEVKGPAPGVAVRYGRRDGHAVAVPGACYDGLEERVLGALASAGVRDRCTIIAFNPAVLARVRDVDPGQRTSLLVAGPHVELAGARPEDTVAWAVAAGAADVGVQHTLATEELVAAARAAGVTVGVWTANDEPTLRRMAELGVDVITSDRPDLALRVLGRA
jgi:glycerophosphoryl diester phosphodiesterase